MNIHFIELRKRMLLSIFFFINIFLVLFYFSDIIYDLFSMPIRTQMPINSNIVAIKVTSTFLIPLKLSFNLTLICSIPFFIFHIWSFIAPGLYDHEKTSILPYLFFSILLFLLGNIFAFYILCPIAINFFMTCSPNSVSIMIGINYYMDFVFSIMLAAGFSFQIPILINFLTRVNIVSKQYLSSRRSYVIILSFILGMILTPPDVISQILLAIPICFLFEIGLFFSK